MEVLREDRLRERNVEEERDEQGMMRLFVFAPNNKLD
jgi:hypothetical protein